MTNVTRLSSYAFRPVVSAAPAKGRRLLFVAAAQCFCRLFLAVAFRTASVPVPTCLRLHHFVSKILKKMYIVVCIYTHSITHVHILCDRFLMVFDPHLPWFQWICLDSSKTFKMFRDVRHFSPQDRGGLPLSWWVAEIKRSPVCLTYLEKQNTQSSFWIAKALQIAGLQLIHIMT